MEKKNFRARKIFERVHSLKKNRRFQSSEIRAETLDSGSWDRAECKYTKLDGAISYSFLRKSCPKLTFGPIFAKIFGGQNLGTIGPVFRFYLLNEWKSTFGVKKIFPGNEIARPIGSVSDLN